MVYLLKSGNYLKIGYSQDIKKRLQNYSTHNPDIVLLDTIEGDESMEKMLHNLCKEFRLNNKQEWFHLNPFVIEVWNSFKDSEYIEIPKSKIDIDYVNLDYKEKFEETLYELFKVKEELISEKEKYWKIRDELFNTNNDLDSYRHYKQKYIDASIENDNLKTRLLETQTKYVALLEKQS